MNASLPFAFSPWRVDVYASLASTVGGRAGMACVRTQGKVSCPRGNPYLSLYRFALQGHDYHTLF